MRRDAIAVLMCVVAFACAGCKEDGTVQVSSVSFSGNKGIKTGALRAVISTRQNSIVPFSKRHYFDRPEFDRDVQRIEAYYADHGYPHAKVTGVDVKLNDAKTRVAITVNITEGAPVIVESVSIDGLDGVPDNHVQQLKAILPDMQGKTRNQPLVLATHDQVVSELKDHGFPYATATVIEQTGKSDDFVRIGIFADPGPRAVFGAVTIEGNKSVGEEVIRRELTFREGEQYRLGETTESQRRLYGLQLFQFANITPRLPEQRTEKVPVVVTVAEGKLRKVQLALGYGSEEKARGRVNWQHANFTGGARSLDTEAKWSSLERGFRGTFTEPYLLRPGVSLRLTGSSWWASEPAYTYRSSGGRAILTKDFSRGPAGVDRGTRNEFRATLIDEYESYKIGDDALADPTLRDEFIALGLDPVTGKGNGRLSALEFDYDRDTSSQPLDPRHGYSLAAHVETSDKWLGGSFRYNEFVLEGRKYFQIGEHFVWASRAKVGTLAGSNSALIPFFKRYFVGGSTSLRGWGRYQVSPLSDGGLPIGGRTIADLSTEARFAVRGRVSGVFFVDGGNVWADPWHAGPGGLRYAVGPGLRYNTPIGPIRVDFGKQVNPIPGLKINGVNETRKWRLHFSIGQAF